MNREHLLMQTPVPTEGAQIPKQERDHSPLNHDYPVKSESFPMLPDTFSLSAEYRM